MSKDKVLNTKMRVLVSITNEYGNPVSSEAEWFVPYPIFGMEDPKQFDNNELRAKVQSVATQCFNNIIGISEMTYDERIDYMTDSILDD